MLRASVVFIPLWFISPVMAAPTGVLNDSGQQRCLDATGSALQACTSANSGNGAAYPGQDGRFGRDPAVAMSDRSGLIKAEGSGGRAGFNFTPLDISGQPIPLAGTPKIPSSTPRCVWDRVTNLIWEVKTTDGGLQDWIWTYAWGSNTSSLCTLGTDLCNTDNYIIALNAANVCPVNGSGEWRLPTFRELLSIVDHDASIAPSIDGDYFPNTVQAYYWTTEEVAPPNGLIWTLAFFSGLSGASDSTVTNFVRLVRNGP